LKICTKCLEEKLLELFRLRKKRGKIVQVSVCKQCESRDNKIWRLNHKEQLRKYQRDNKEKYKKSKTKYLSNEDNLEKSREYARNRMAYLRKTDPEYIKRIKYNNSVLRRIKIHDSPSESIDPMKIAIRDKWICGICHKKVAREYMNIDHIIPLSKGGLHVWWNVRLTHRKCNFIKHDKLVDTQIGFLWQL